jgi:diguanylate cyclase (GGDEF)-like protein
MNIKGIANTVGSVVIEGLKEIRSKKVPLTATTLANYLKENEEFNKIFSGISDCDTMQDLRTFLIEKATFFASVLNLPEFIQLKEQIEKDKECYDLKNYTINLISLVAEYLDKSINIQSRLKNILEEIVIRFDKTSMALNNILEENSNILKKDIEDDKKIATELVGVNQVVLNESSIEALKEIVLSKVERLSEEISKKIDHKSTALVHIEKEKESVNRELSEYKKREQELIKLRKELEKYKVESVTDPLTGLFNRKFLVKKFEEEMERSKRYNSKFSVIFIDIDNFKRINDVYGHIVGDFVLKYLANIIKSELRKVDYAFRYGGEEMVVLLSETDLDGAMKFANRLLETVRNTIFRYKTEELKITVSMGVVEYKTGEPLDQIINRADAAMYRAKKEGKDRVISG